MIAAAVRLTCWTLQLPAIVLLGRSARASCSHAAGSYVTRAGDPRCVVCAAPVSRS